MPTVLITGLNGFVAAHTAVIFLQNDWNVRGTVRSQDKADKVKTLPALQSYFDQGRIETVIVEDLIKGDFTEALKGVDGVSSSLTGPSRCRHTPIVLQIQDVN